MMTTTDLLEAIALLHNVPSDYAMAKLLGISKQAMSDYRHKGATLNNKTAFRAAELLQFPPGKVVAWMEAERAKDDGLRSWWTQRAAALAASILMACGLAVEPSPAGAAISQVVESEYYVNRRQRTRRRQFAPLEPLKHTVARWMPQRLS